MKSHRYSQRDSTVLQTQGKRDLCLVVKWPLFLEYSNGGWCWKEVHLHHHPHLLRFLGFKLLKLVLLFSLLLPTWDSSINAHYYHIIIFFTKVKERSLIYTRTISFYGKRKIKYIGRWTSRRARLTLFFSSIDRERFIVVNLSLPDLDLVYL